MSNLEITNNDLGSVILKNGEFRDDLLTVAGAVTVKEGTILARRAVAVAVVAAADGGNTGDGTTTLATVVAGPVIPLVGAYNLEVTEAIANGGVLKLEDPNGAQVASGLAMTVGAGGVTVFEAAGLQFSVTDGATDFIVGDKFSLTVAADGKLVPFEKDGAGGAQIPKKVLTYEVVTTGAGDVAIRDMTSGSVRAARLVIDSDGDASNIDAAVLDQLQDYSLVAIDVSELNILDNQ